MSGAMRRIGEYLGLLEDTGRYDDDYADTYDSYDDRNDDRYDDRYDDETSPVAVAKPTRREAREARQAATVANLDDRRRGGAPVVTAPRVAELSRITTLHPRTYNEARTVGENYRDGTPVIMNLTEMDDNDAKRLVDFAAGLIFATRGSIERVTSKVFLLSPPNVSVAAEDKARIADGGFFNQS
jgi:cell division inhibitor SepF